MQQIIRFAVRCLAIIVLLLFIGWLGGTIADHTSPLLAAVLVLGTVAAVTWELGR